MKIGDQIREARNRLGMSQDDLAERIHVSRGKISHWETGLRPPKPEEIRELEEVLQCKFEIEQEQAQSPEGQAAESVDSPSETESAAKKSVLLALLQKSVPAWLCAAIVGCVFAVMLVIMLCTTSNLQKQIDALTQPVTAPLKQAAALHQIPADPAVGIRLPTKDNVKKDERAVEAYSPEEQEALFRVLDTNSRPGYAAIALMIETGLRVGEVLALRWRDVQISRKRVAVRATVVRLANKKLSYVQESAKSAASNRTIPLTPRAIAVLEHQQHERINEWVFNNVDNERLSYEALRHQTRRLCEEAKVEYRGEHVFRHTFATNCYYKGVNVKVLSKLLGHADVNVTYNIYVHLYGDGFDEMYSALVSEK